MSRELLVNHPSITNYSTIWTDSLRNGKSALSNTNKLVRNYSGCTGLKTGSTSLALFNLSASATRDGLSLIAVIMKAPTSALRFSNASTLLDYGFANFESIKICSKNQKLSTLKLKKADCESVDLVAKNDLGILIKKGESKDFTKKIEIDKSLKLPIKCGTTLGKVKIYRGDKLI